jgi:hypothetical protein
MEMPDVVILSSRLPRVERKVRNSRPVAQPLKIGEPLTALRAGIRALAALAFLISNRQPNRETLVRLFDRNFDRIVTQVSKFEQI